MKTPMKNMVPYGIFAFVVFALFCGAVPSGKQRFEDSGDKGVFRDPKTTLMVADPSSDPILGEIPEPKPDLAPGTRVLIGFGHKARSCWEFAELAVQRVAKEEGTPVPSDIQVDIYINPGGKGAFIQVLLLQGIGKNCWEVTFDRKMKIMSYKRLKMRAD